MYVLRALQGNSPIQAGHCNVFIVKLGNFRTVVVESVLNAKISHQAHILEMDLRMGPAFIKKYPGILNPTNLAFGNAWMVITGMQITVFGAQKAQMCAQ